MPRRDGSGPLGRGAMTGRGLGKCLNGGFGRRVSISLEEEKKMLESRLKEIASLLKG